MDVNTTTTTTTTHAPSLSKSPERESQTPPRIKAISSSNGVLKRHFIHHAPPIPVAAVYKECLKNHAASIGGHALDGCGEFLPAPTATPADPTSLKCAACGCHRNFHRREPEDFTAVSPVIEYHPHHRHHPLPPAPPNQTHALHPPPHAARESASPPPISSSYMLLALSGAGGGGGGGAAAAHNVMNSSGSGHPNSSSRKRFRTKFSQDQKDKMYELAEKVGWKLQKTNEEMVNGICSDIGVERGVFKVWMHNNKNTFAKRSTAIAAVSGGSSDHRNGDFKSEENNNNGGLTHHHHHHHHTYNGKSNESNDPANASSSSS